MRVSSELRGLKDVLGVKKEDVGVMTDLTGIQMEVDKQVLLEEIGVSK